MKTQQAFRVGPDSSSGVLSSNDLDVLSLFFMHGASPSFVRAGLNTQEAKIFLSPESGKSSNGGCVKSEVMYLAWAPCLSSQAFARVTNEFSIDKDFLPITLAESGEQVFMHLPQELVGPVVLERCAFEEVISIDPFIANGLKRLSLKQTQTSISALFRPSAMGLDMGLADLVASPEFVKFWRDCKFNGFSFREIEVDFV